MRRRDLLQAIGANHSAPADVLLRLLADEASEPWDRAAWVSWRGEFPEEVVDAIVAHPEKRIRMALAENGFVSGETRARLIDDPTKGVRLCLAMGPSLFRIESPPLPEWAQRHRGRRGHEPVARSELGDQMNRLLRIGFELSSQPGHVETQVPAVTGIARPPNHTALKGQPPASRVPNLSGHYT